MQNKATWLQSTPDGYKVRVQFMPFNEAEQKKIQALLMDPQVAVLMATTQGPLTIDLMFTSKPVPVTKPAAVTAKPPAQAPAPVDTQKAAAGMAKPDASDKVQ